MRIAIEGGGYDSAAKALFGGNSLAALYYTSLKGKLGGYGSMAGDDSTSEEFSQGYDDAAREAVGGLGDLVDAFANLGVLAAQSIDNHRKANAGSVYAKPAPVYDGTGSLPNGGPVDVPSYTPPSSLGGDDEDLPKFWNEIQDHLEGFAWPNADTGTLRSAGGTWRSAASDVERLRDYCDTASDLLSDQRSPEVPLAREALRDLKTAIGDLAEGFRSVGDACDDYAGQVEEHREIIKGIIQDMAIEAGVSMVVGGVVAFFTFGGGAAAGTAVAGWRIAAAAKKILTALRALKAAAKARAVAKLTSVVSKVKPLRSVLTKFKDAKKIKKAAKAADEKPPTPPVRKPGDALPDEDRPGSAGEDWPGRVADNGKGDVWQSPNATHKYGDMVREMEPTDKYPDGYVRFTNDQGQPIGLDGKPNVPGGSKADNLEHTHIPMNPDGTYPIPKGWNP